MLEGQDIVPSYHLKYGLHSRSKPTTCKGSCPQYKPEEIVKVAELKKHKEDNFTCRGHILNSLSDGLYDLYMSMQSLVEICKAIEREIQHRATIY
ncbi:hypothetical protein J1N35_010866 [Gossypium stocksii]|uniref:Uncharacterized protein n=1 Tax=Gossypium stocksii TaxID=47602 RepID=A0A9D4ACQ7_9ROSI|nr:hypothetical protein J1N35_010866 [Gossypium stocksii]